MQSDLTLETYESAPINSSVIFYNDHPTCDSDDQGVKFKLPSVIYNGESFTTTQSLTFADGTVHQAVGVYSSTENLC